MSERRLGGSEIILNLEKRTLGRLPLNYELIGRENIEHMRQLLNERENVVVVIDHRSIGDTASGAIMAFREELDDVFQRMVIVVSQKYLKNPVTGPLLKGVRTISVISSSMKDKSRQKELGRQALRDLHNLPEGTLVVLAPEGARIKSGKMARGLKESASFLNGRKETHLVPIAVEGTEEQWPDGISGPFRYFLGGLRKPARFIIGSPVPVDYLRRIARDLTQDNPQERKQLEVDLAMLQIALLHLRHGDPKYVRDSFYEELINRLGIQINQLFPQSIG